MAEILIGSIKKGEAEGVAELDANGRVPVTQLPSYVFDAAAAAAAQLAGEASTRAAADTALGARIDNIIAPEGDPSLTELADVRNGYDGKTYATAGAAVRAQADTLFNYDAFLQEKDDVGFTFDSIGLTRGHYLNPANGKAVAYSDFWLSDFIPVYQGMVIQYRLSAGTASSIICEYSHDDQASFIRSAVAGAGYGNAVAGEYTPPSGVNYIRICTHKWDETETYTPIGRVYDPFIRIKDSIAANFEKTKTLEFIDTGNILERISFFTKAYIDLQGNPNKSTSVYHATIRPIPVFEGLIIKYAAFASTNNSIIACYDDKWNYVSSPVIGAGATLLSQEKKGYYVVPANVKYVRFGYADFSQYQPKFEFTRYADTVEKIVEDKTEAIDAIKNALRYDFVLESSSRLIKPFTLLHFTDIHGTKDALERIVEFRNANETLIDDVICTGDMVTASVAYQGMDFWDEVDGAEDILMTIGNHDLVTQATGGTQLTVQEQYEMYIEPYASNWNAQTVENKTWYYKDYVDKQIRLVVVGALLNSSEEQLQTQWLVDVLQSAKTLHYSVIVAQHFQPLNEAFMESNFTQVYGKSVSAYPYTLDDSVQSAVQDFIDAGGDFICHIGGHTHQDQVMYNGDYPDQLCIIATTASSEYLQQQFGDQARIKNEKSIDAFNVMTVDVNKKLLKIVRVGADQDMLLRSRKFICINYDTREIIYQG